MESKKPKTRIGCVIGTRPEAIKMAPIIFLLQNTPWAEVILIDTVQHRDLLDDILLTFDLKPDYYLNIMTPNQSLGHLTGELSLKLDRLLHENSVDILLGAGDTTTVMVSSLIAFYHHIPFGHIEAGLRTHDNKTPFPEEINRVLTAPLATWHFVPTADEKNNLLAENIVESKIYITGNPVIDSMYWVVENIQDNGRFGYLDNIIVVTAHRRENIGQNLDNICQALIELCRRFEHINIVLPMHPNPNVQSQIKQSLGKINQIHLINPLKYDEFIHLMHRSLFIMTDSGGIQEEAPALKKPVVILRSTTERTAVIKEGLGLLAGTKIDSIISAASDLLTNKTLYAKMSRGVSPYGDGCASQRIVAFLEDYVIKNKI